jgi:hypothetical protein
MESGASARGAVKADGPIVNFSKLDRVYTKNDAIRRRTTRRPVWLANNHGSAELFSPQELDRLEHTLTTRASAVNLTRKLGLSLFGLEDVLKGTLFWSLD